MNYVVYLSDHIFHLIEEYCHHAEIRKTEFIKDAFNFYLSNKDYAEKRIAPSNCFFASKPKRKAPYRLNFSLDGELATLLRYYNHAGDVVSDGVYVFTGKGVYEGKTFHLGTFIEMIARKYARHIKIEERIESMAGIGEEINF